MTLEREKEIRELTEAGNEPTCANELLAEIDRLRELLTSIMGGDSWRYYALVAQELDRLRAQAIEREETNMQLTTELVQLTEENQRLLSLQVEHDIEHPTYKLAKELEEKLAVAVEALELTQNNIDHALSKIRGEK